MKKALCIASAVFLLAGMASAELVPLRLVADFADMPDNTLQHPSPFGTGLTPGSGPGYDANGNPVIDVDPCPGDPVTINLWAEVDLDHQWNGLGFDMHCVCSGPGECFASATLDIAVDKWTVKSATGNFRVKLADQGGYARWDPGSDNYADCSDPNDLVTMVSVTYANLGGDGDIGLGATSYYSAGEYFVATRGTWFKLGTITMDCADCCPGTCELYLSYQPTNFVGGLKGESIIYYGWGAAGIVNSDDHLGDLSDVPLVTLNCVPEPASLILLALVGLVLRRR